MLINREDLLHQLESVQAGLSSREIIEQSSCFVFQNGRVYTYNDEVACSIKTSLTLDGAVQAAPLLAILGKLAEPELEVEEGANGELVFVGKKRRIELVREAKVNLPIDKVEVPTEWRPLTGDFVEAVGLVQHCASRDESKFSLTCIHIAPKFIEACDNYQVTRVKVLTGVESSVLVRSTSLKNIVSLGMEKVSETESWIHFQNATGLILSCRRYVETYPDLKAILQMEGHPITIPRGLGEAADRAAVFATDTSGECQVSIEVKPGKLRIKGTGAAGNYVEMKKLIYDGPHLSFLIAPELLIEITKRHTDAEVNGQKLKVNGGKWVYVTCLGAVKEESAPAEDTPAE